MEELAHINYIGFVDVFRDRTDAAVLAFSRIVTTLESHSTLCERFFAIPLQTAKSLLQRSLAIQEGLRPEIPDFESLVPMSVTLRSEQNVFNNMGKIADNQLRVGGFTAPNMLSTYTSWKRVTDNDISISTYIFDEFDRNYGHHEFMEEIFSLPVVDIFHTAISAEENNGLATNIRYVNYQWSDWDEPQNNHSNVSRIFFLRGRKFSENSTYASSDLSNEEGYSDRDKNEDMVYIPVELGEYEEFEKMCIAEEELQPTG